MGPAGLRAIRNKRISFSTAGWVRRFAITPRLAAGRLDSPRCRPSCFLSSTGWRAGGLGEGDGWRCGREGRNSHCAREQNRIEHTKNWRQAMELSQSLRQRNGLLARILPVYSRPERWCCPPVLDSRPFNAVPPRVVGGATAGGCHHRQSVSSLSPSDTPQPFFQK